MNYKRYFYGGGWIVSLLFCKIVLAQSLVINLYDTQGQGIDVNNVQINNILIDTLVQNPLTGLPEWIAVPYSFVFRACQGDPVDPNTLYLEPLLTGAEPPCYISPLDFTDTQVVSGMNDNNGIPLRNWVQLNNVREYTEEMDLLNPNHSELTTTYYNMTLELNLEKLRLEQREKYSISPPLINSMSSLKSDHQIMIVLSWDGNRRLDFDAHLTGPAPGLVGSYNNEPDRFHIYFGNKINEIAHLYTDDFSNSQPETMEISPPPGQEKLRPGIYRYSVHQFQGNGNFVEAKVQVHLWIGGLEQVFEPLLPPGNDDKYWNSIMYKWEVFELIVSEDGMIQVQLQQNYAPSNPAEVRRKVN